MNHKAVAENARYNFIRLQLARVKGNEFDVTNLLIARDRHEEGGGGGNWP